jgi:pimeloyl-ACP methyl ester carboxylesterase
LGDITASGKQIAIFIEKVLAATHATKVDLVGHSEGAFMSLWVPKETGLAKDINKVVAIAPPTHGTTFGGLVSVGQDFSAMPEVDAILQLGCVACSQLITGGSAVRTLDQGMIAQPGIDYTIIASRTDELVTPTSTAFVEEPDVTNAYVQTTCPDDPVGHLGEAFDADIEQMITNTLDPTTAHPVTCSIGPPF